MKKEQLHKELEAELRAEEAGLEAVLGDLKRSVDKWSEAAYQRPRPIVVHSGSWSWRLTGGGVACGMLLAGILTASLNQPHHDTAAFVTAPVTQPERPVVEVQENEPQAATPELKKIPSALTEVREVRRMVAAKPVEEEDLLAKVDSEVARQVPSAMEPLARLMAEDETR